VKSFTSFGPVNSIDKLACAHLERHGPEGNVTPIKERALISARSELRMQPTATPMKLWNQKAPCRRDSIRISSDPVATN